MSGSRSRKATRPPRATLPAFLLTTVTAMAALAGAVAPGAVAATNGAPAGPDVASYQHPSNEPIDWAQVRRSGASFAFIKATEGHTYTNPYFASDYSAAQSNGLVRSAYHYARPALPLSTATQQADYLLSTVGTTAAQGDLPVTLDLEETGGLGSSDLVAWAKTFLQRVSARTGRTPVLYSYPYFWRHAMGDSHAFTSYPLWIADYSGRSTPGPLPGGWQSWTFWQRTSSGRQPGIAGEVDLNDFHGDTAALQQLATPPGKQPAPSLLPIPLPSLAARPH